MFNQRKVHFFDPQSILCKFDGDREIEEGKLFSNFQFFESFLVLFYSGYVRSVYIKHVGSRFNPSL